jgi:hypothetical protein
MAGPDEEEMLGRVGKGMLDVGKGGELRRPGWRRGDGRAERGMGQCARRPTRGSIAPP